MPRMRPRRWFMSPVMSPMYWSGTMTLTVMIGSSSTGLALLMPSLNARAEAILNAISEESTSW